MKIEKICEYFNNIGILKIENINRFLKIYSQLSHNNYRNKSDKIILALFSYMTLVSKNENNLYEICKNIINKFLNNQILQKYRALNSLNNVFTSKIHSKYSLFFMKFYSYLYIKNRKIRIIHLNKKLRPNNSMLNDGVQTKNDNEEKFINLNTSLDKNRKIIIPQINGRISKKQIKRTNNIRSEILNNEEECTFSPKINHNYKSNSKNSKRYEYNYSNNNYIKNNNESEILPSYNNIWQFKDNKFNKIISFKNSINYSNNNKINNEIQKMLTNISKFSNNPNNSKYLPQKTIYRKQIYSLNPSYSYKELPFYLNTDNNVSNINNNRDNSIYNYYDNDYDFYQNEKDHIKKVQDKILQLKLQKMEKISKECTFSPELNEYSRYLNYNKLINTNNNNNDISSDFNISNINYFSNSERYNNYNHPKAINTFNNQKSSAKKRTKSYIAREEYENDYYDIYPNKNINKKKRTRSYSGSKNNNISSNDYSIYKQRKEELSKLFQEQYPFAPNIKYNKNYPIKSTFSERQKQFIKNKEKMSRIKDEEELKMMEEFKKRNYSFKINSKEVVKRLYDKEAIKIKERLKKEKEEKSKGKKVIDWNKRKKQYKEKYPEDFSRNKKYENIKLNNDINNYDIYLDNNNNFDNENYNYEQNIDNIINQEEINNKRQLLMDKIKDEHIIGFKNNNINNQEIENDNYKIKENIDYNYREDNVNINEPITSKDRNSNEEEKLYNLEEKMKNFQNSNFLENINNKEGIKSNTFQEMINKLHNQYS